MCVSPSVDLPIQTFIHWVEPLIDPLCTWKEEDDIIVAEAEGTTGGTWAPTIPAGYN